MRALLVILALAALLAAALIYWGLLNFDQVRPAVVQPPKFEASVGRVGVGTENRTVTVPTLEVERAGNTQ